MKWARKKINVDLTDKAIEFITRSAEKNGTTFQEELQAIFFTELQREMLEEKEGYKVIPVR